MIEDKKKVKNQIESKIDLISKGTKVAKTKLDSLYSNPIKDSSIDIKKLLSKTSLFLSKGQRLLEQLTSDKYNDYTGFYSSYIGTYTNYYKNRINNLYRTLDLLIKILTFSSTILTSILVIKDVENIINRELLAKLLFFIILAILLSIPFVLSSISNLHRELKNHIKLALKNQEFLLEKIYDIKSLKLDKIFKEVDLTLSEAKNLIDKDKDYINQREKEIQEIKEILTKNNKLILQAKKEIKEMQEGKNK